MLRHVREDELVELAVLLSGADAAEEQDPAYREELAAWVRDSGDGDGLPTSAVESPAGRGSSLRLRDFTLSASERSSGAAPPAERPDVVVLSTQDDAPAAWLRAGRALGLLLLDAAAAGVQAQPLGQVTDLPGPRHRLAAVLGLRGVPQLVLRLGVVSARGFHTAASGRRGRRAARRARLGGGRQCCAAGRLGAVTDRLRVFLLDDHELVRRGVRELLEADGEIEVVGEAATAAEALARVPALRPRVAVLDVRLPDGDGVSVCRELRSQLPDLACLMLTSFSDDDALLDAVLAGASGYVLKDIRGGDLVGAVRTVAAGGSLLDSASTANVLARLRAKPAADPLAVLTDQERRILDLIGEGLTNRQIGERMFLAEKTVKNYVSSLLSKLGLQRRTQAAVLATERRRDGL
jgi:DNA-binding NarL/FixJ family response regulator